MKVIFLAFLATFIFFSCSSKSQNNIEINKEQLSEYKFKKWLQDTLVSLTSYKYDTNIVKERIISVSEDSLFLNEDKKYSIIFNPTQKYTRNINAILSSLSDCGELPSTPCRIDFLHNMIYYPTFVEQLEYGFQLHFEEIYVFDREIKTEYSYSKGSLTDKTMFYPDGSVEEYSFPFEEGKIVTKLIRSY